MNARGFTLIEVLVVVALIALAAAAIVPRLTGNEARAAQAAAEDVADILTMFAHRESMGHSDVALGYDPESRAIMLLRLMGDPSNPEDPPRWDIDQFERPVLLPDSLEVIEVRENGTRVDRGDWFIPVVPGQTRPSVEVILAGPHHTYTVVLPQDGMSARLILPGASFEAIREPIDLDALGRDREVW